MNNAYKALKEFSLPIVKHFLDDIERYDLSMIRRYSDHRYVFLLRDCGSHILVLGGDDSSEGIKKMAKFLVRQNTDFAYWNGAALEIKTRDSVIRLIEENNILRIGA